MRRGWAVVSALLVGRLAAQVDVGGVVLQPGPQDRVTVTQEAWRWGGGATTYPAVNVALQSGRFRYTLRHDQAYGQGSIGLCEPNSCSWYQSGMLDLLVNGRRVELLPANHETITLRSGPVGVARLSWSDDRAEVTQTYVLRTGEDRLYLLVDLRPKVAVTSLEARLTSYPSGFNHEPRHRLRTPLRELAPSGRQSFGPAREPSLFLADDALDVATNPAAAGPCAVAFDPAAVTAASVWTGGYGVGTQLTCRPDARRLAFCFWIFPGRSNADGLARWSAACDAALAVLRQPEEWWR